MPEANPNVANQAPNHVIRIGNLVHGRGDIIHLEYGEPNFPTPPHIVEAAHRSLRDERQGYGPGNGIPALREAIATRVARVNGFAPDASQVIATPGGTGAVMAAFLTLCVPGDEVLIPDPAWPGYDAALVISGARPVRYALDPTNNWQPDIDALESLITPRTRVLLINSPSNPTGAVFPRETLQQLAEFAERHDLWILSDECYDEVVFDGDSVSPATLGAAERTVTIGTCSKAYAMTGWRVGWAIVPQRMAGAFTMVVAAQVNNLPLFAQRAAQTALSGPQDCVGEMVAAYRHRRDMSIELLGARGLLEYTPEGAFYLLIPAARAANLGDGAAFDSVDFAERLIEAKQIAIAPGIAFGPSATNYARISLASSEDDLRAGITGLVDFAASWARS